MTAQFVLVEVEPVLLEPDVIRAAQEQALQDEQRRSEEFLTARLLAKAEQIKARAMEPEWVI